MNKNFTLLQLFSIVDERLSTNMGDVYEILNHVCDDNLMTHHLPTAMKYLKEKKPDWFVEATKNIQATKDILETHGFEVLIESISKEKSVYSIPQLKDEFDTSDFGSYMVDNSLLLKIGT